MKVFYLGPAGTFTQDAARSYFTDTEGQEFEPCGTPTDVMRRLTAHQEGYGVVPIENSIHGEVTPTLDALCFEFPGIYVIGEVSIPISFNWYGIDPAARPITVVSHPHALAQCRRFIASRGLVEQTASSTAEACRLVAERNDSTLSAIASPTAGALFGLAALDKEIDDFKGAYTRFLVLANQLALSDTANRTMLALLPPSNKAGILAQLSGAFSDFGVNIFGIHNRPLRTGPGHYLFVVTVEGNTAADPTSSAIDRLLSAGYGVKLLGVYAAWPGNLPSAPWPHLPGLLDPASYKRVIDEAIARR